MMQVFDYQLGQTTAEKERYQYDKSCYEITVYVKNSENGELVSEVVAEKEMGEKVPEIWNSEFLSGKSTNLQEPSNSSKPNDPGKPVKTR